MTNERIFVRWRGWVSGLLAAVAWLSAGDVHAAAPEGRYLVTTDTVADTQTGLTWQRAVSTSLYTWAGAKTYCEALELDGLTGWRVPTSKELRSLVDPRVRSPAIDATAFPNTQSGRFWTSSTYSDPSMWYVDFGLGVVAYADAGNRYRVRCVR